MAGWWEKINAWLTRGTARDESLDAVPLQGYARDLTYFQELFKHASDFTAREFRLGLAGKRTATLYLRSLADEARIAAEVILPLSSMPALVENAPHASHVHTSAISWRAAP
ncbi:MAG: hypothetical protein DDT20_00204 [Firmicutes bacterium]|nr:hypothetical protein [Bacillota bacterium]